VCSAERQTQRAAPARQSTGEAAVDALALNAGDQCGWVSTTRELLRRFVAAHFPTHREVPSSGAKGARRASARPADVHLFQVS
jgi:hypothetical protein